MSEKLKSFIFLCLLTLPTCTNVAVAQTDDTTKQIKVLEQQLAMFKAEKPLLEEEKRILEKRIQECSTKQSETCNASPIKTELESTKTKIEYTSCKIASILLDINVEKNVKKEEEIKKRNLTDGEYSEIRNHIIQKEGTYYECEISEK